MRGTRITRALYFIPCHFWYILCYLVCVPRGAVLCSSVSSYQSALLYLACTPTLYTGLQRELAFIRWSRLSVKDTASIGMNDFGEPGLGFLPLRRSMITLDLFLEP